MDRLNCGRADNDCLSVVGGRRVVLDDDRGRTGP